MPSDISVEWPLTDVVPVVKWLGKDFKKCPFHNTKVIEPLSFYSSSSEGPNSSVEMKDLNFKPYLKCVLTVS